MPQFPTPEYPMAYGADTCLIRAKAVGDEASRRAAALVSERTYQVVAREDCATNLTHHRYLLSFLDPTEDVAGAELTYHDGEDEFEAIPHVALLSLEALLTVEDAMLSDIEQATRMSTPRLLPVEDPTEQQGLFEPGRMPE